MKIVLAYSGGLDTSVIVKWLRETYDAEIITFAADIGQEEELKGLSRKARSTGASGPSPPPPGRRVRPRLRLPHDTRGGGVRGAVPPWHVHRPAADREGAGRDR